VLKGETAEMFCHYKGKVLGQRLRDVELSLLRNGELWKYQAHLVIAWLFLLFLRTTERFF
jgi:hypothetical protein